jgi:AraC-like DNA-binding protein
LNSKDKGSTHLERPRRKQSQDQTSQIPNSKDEESTYLKRPSREHTQDNTSKISNSKDEGSTFLKRPRREHTQDKISKISNSKDEDKFVADISNRHKRFGEGTVAQKDRPLPETTTKPLLKRQLTDKEISQIRVLRDKGLCVAEIAEKVDSALSTLQKRWQITFGEPLRTKESQDTYTLTPDQVLEVEVYLSEGKSFTPLCEKFASTKDAIMEAYRKAKLAPLPPLTRDQVSAIETYFDEKGKTGRWAEIASTLGLQSLTLADQFKHQVGRQPAGRGYKHGRPLNEEEIFAVRRYFAQKSGNGSWDKIAEQLHVDKRWLYRKWRDRVGDPPPGALRRSVPLTLDDIVMIEEYRSQKMTWQVIADKMGKDAHHLRNQYSIRRKSLEMRQQKEDS